MARDVTIRYVGDSASAERAAARVRAANDKLSSGFANVSKSASQNFRRVGSSLTSAGRSITTFATLPIAGGFGLALKAASDLNEQASKMKTVFGEQSASIESFASNAARNIGLSKKAAFEATGTFGNMFNQLGFGAHETAAFSQALTVAAADLASFHNADITQVIEAQTAAFRGEYDSLQRFVPTINAAAVQQQAMAETGKKNAQQLTQGEKAAATYTLMMEGMGKAQGDFARTSDSAANQQRILTARFQDLAASIGQQLLPVALQFGELLAGLLDRFNQLSPTVRKFILIGAGLLAVLGPVVGAVGALATVFGLIISPIGLVIVGLAALTLGIIYAYKHSETFRDVIQSVMDWLTGSAIPAIQEFARSFTETFRGIGEAVTHIMNVIRDVVNVVLAVIAVLWRKFGDDLMHYVRGVWQVIASIVKGFMGVIQGTIKLFIALINGDWGKAWNAIKQIFSSIWQTIAGVLKGFLTQMRGSLGAALEVLKTIWSNAWNAIWRGLTSIWDTILTFFRRLPGNIASAIGNVAGTLLAKGKSIIGGFLEGIKRGAGAIKDWFEDLPGRIWDWIGFGSPPKWAIRGGGYIIQGLLEGMTNRIGTVKRWLKDEFGDLLLNALAAVGNFFTGGPQGTLARSNAMLGRQMAQSFGWTGSQWDALNSLVMSESGWSNTAQNPTSTAYGIGQFLDSTWATVGASKTSDPGAQIAAMLAYIRQRYGDPMAAWAFKQSHNWYEKGGVVSGPVGRAQPAVVHGGEGIFTPTQMRHLSINGGGGGTVINNHYHIAGSVWSERELVDVLNRQLDRGARLGAHGRRSA